MRSRTIGCELICRVTCFRALEVFSLINTCPPTVMPRFPRKVRSGISITPPQTSTTPLVFLMVNSPAAVPSGAAWISGTNKAPFARVMVKLVAVNVSVRVASMRTLTASKILYSTAPATEILNSVGVSVMVMTP